jgi:hypothetical protein
VHLAPRVQPAQSQSVPPQAQMPSSLPPPRSAYQEPGKVTPAGNPTPDIGRQQRGLHDLRRIRGLGRRQEDAKGRRFPPDDDHSIEPPPFLRRGD